MRAKSLTANIIAKRTPFILERDYGNEEPTCCFCDQRFISKNPKWQKTWEHLDNNDTNEELWNLAWAHWICNEKKKFDSDLQILAKEIIKKNKSWQESIDFESAGEREKMIQMETGAEIDSNREFSKITLEYLIENLLPCGRNPSISEEIDFKEALDTIALRCYHLYKHASQNTVRRILDMFCSNEGDFEKTKRNGRWKIVKRNGR